ncbi:MAG: phage holin family protein [Gemmatimonadetes bacterium]|nr:phage holin family protein [Gemmatimonadota bacterium]
MGFIVHTLVSAALLYVVGRLVDGIEVRDGKAAVFGALGLGLANAFVRPILIKLTLPITVITLGLFVFVVNALMIMLAAAFVDGFEVDDFPSALWAALALGLMNFLVAMFFGL